MESVDFPTGPDLVSYILETHIYLLNMYPKSEFKRIKKLHGQSLLEWNRKWVRIKKDTQLMASSSPVLWDSQKASRCLPPFFAPSPCFLVWLAYGGSDFFLLFSSMKITTLSSSYVSVITKTVTMKTSSLYPSASGGWRSNKAWCFQALQQRNKESKSKGKRRCKLCTIFLLRQPTESQ